MENNEGIEEENNKNVLKQLLPSKLESNETRSAIAQLLSLPPNPAEPSPTSFITQLDEKKLLQQPGINILIKACKKLRLHSLATLLQQSLEKVFRDTQKFPLTLSILSVVCL